MFSDDCRTYFVSHLRNRKHVPCFYRVIETRVEVWENEKCCGNTSRRRVFPQLFRVLPNFHECKFSLLAPSSRQQLVLVLCFHRVIETRFLTNQRAYFLRTVSKLLCLQRLQIQNSSLLPHLLDPGSLPNINPTIFTTKFFPKIGSSETKLNPPKRPLE